MFPQQNTMKFHFAAALALLASAVPSASALAAPKHHDKLAKFNKLGGAPGQAAVDSVGLPDKYQNKFEKNKDYHDEGDIEGTPDYYGEKFKTLTM